MNLAAPLNEEERTNVPALVLAALVHLALIGALFFGVQWKSKEAASVAVELWSAPPPSAVRLPPVVEPKHESKPEAKPEPKPEVKPEPEPKVKPDIAVKDEKKPKPERKPERKPEPKPEPKPKKQEAKALEPERRLDINDELDRDLKKTRQQAAAREMRSLADAELSQLGQAKGGGAGNTRGLEEWSDKVRNKIRKNINSATIRDVQGNPESVFGITQLPTGEVLEVKLRKSSGSKLVDDAIERAIWISSPLPKTERPEQHQRTFELKVRPLSE